MNPTPRLATFLAFCTALACSSDPGRRGDGTSTIGGGSSSSGGSGGSGASSAGGSNGGGSTATGGSGISLGGTLGTGGGTGSGDPEVCDGKDNDGNGVIDDVDAGGDGVCDCLNIATIGQIGPWSNGGNIFRDWLDSRSPIGAVELGDQELTDELLAPFQIVVILYTDTNILTNQDRELYAHHEFSAAESEAFDRWVRAGGGAMATIGYTGNEAAEVINVNRLLSPLGAGYDPDNVNTNGFIEDWATHALTDGVSRINTADGVEPLTTNGTTLAWDSGGRVALQIVEPDDGRVVVWGDEWITYDSEWADQTEQQVELFWLNMLKWLTPPRQCQVAIPPSIR